MRVGDPIKGYERLRYWQERPRSTVLFSQSSWFNANGEFLGSGSLDADDITYITETVGCSDCFMVVQSPGYVIPKDFDTLVRHAQLIIVRGHLYKLREHPGKLRGLAGNYHLIDKLDTVKLNNDQAIRVVRKLRMVTS